MHARFMLLAAFVTAPLAAQAPMPCTNAPERRAFDFFAGEWTVTGPGGSQAGKSSVQIISGGCALLENWTSAGGGVGKSISAYNPALKHWQQFWAGSGGLVTEYRDSEWKGKTLVFVAAGPSVIQHLSFTPNEDGTMHQQGELSTDGGKSWKPTVDLLYRRLP